MRFKVFVGYQASSSAVSSEQAVSTKKARIDYKEVSVKRKSCEY